MDWNLFWIQEVEIVERGLELGFGTFSIAHFIWLAFVAALSAVYIFFYRRGGETRRDNMRKTLAVFLILYEISKQAIMALTGVPVQEYLPLEVCSCAEYSILIAAMWPEGRFLKQPFAYLFLPSAVMALVFPTVVIYPVINFYTIHQFLMHAGIAAYILARISAGEIRPSYQGIWTSMVKLLALVALIYPIDMKFAKNFMFLTWHQNNPALTVLWNVSGGKGGFAYIAALTAFILLVLHVVYLIYVLTKVTGRRKRS